MTELQEGEVLDFDENAYEVFQSLTLDWPCLSFDIIQDRLGQDRTRVSTFCRRFFCQR